MDADIQLTRRRGPLIALVTGILVAVVGLVLVIGFVLDGSTDRPPTVADRHALAERACPQVKVTHLWSIEKNGKTSYLLGTRHAGVALKRFPPIVRESFDKAKTLVVESAGERKREDTLPAPVPVAAEEALGPKAWANYRRLVGDETAAKMSKRSVVEATAAVALLYEDLTQTLDLELEGLARQANKQVVSLDENLDKLSNEYLGVEVIRTLLEQIRDRRILMRDVEQNLAGYCSGNTGTLSGFRGVTDQRTRDWIPKLVPLLEQGDVFIAVGIAHIDMTRVSVADLLRAQGFVVKAL